MLIYCDFWTKRSKIELTGLLLATLWYSRIELVEERENPDGVNENHLGITPIKPVLD